MRVTIDVVQATAVGDRVLHPGDIAEFTIGDGGPILVVQSLPHYLQLALVDAVERGAATLRDASSARLRAALRGLRLVG